MIGAIIGDIVGSVYEFNNTFDYNFPLFSENGSFTDDTICTIAIADAILKGKSYKDSLLEWCRKYPNPMGAYGCSFQQWIFSDDPHPYNSYGNGSAMRASPVGWAFDVYHDVIKEAGEMASTTHNHAEGIKGAQSVALAISSLRFNRDSKDIEHIGNSFYYGFMTQDYPKGKFDETCIGTVPLAFQIILKSTSFEDAIRKAISHGGDSDTLGAIVGSIAEPLFGVPKEIMVKAMSYLPEEMITVVDKFEKRYGHD